MEDYKYGQFKRPHRILLVIAIIFIAFNLRPAITSVGPIIDLLRESLSLSNFSIGILTSLPLIAFGIMSPLVPKISMKYTNETTLIGGMVLLVIGLIVRSIPFVPLLFIGTILIGIGIAIANVLLPGIIKERFPDRVPLMTSVYTTAMSLFAALASGISLPIAVGLDLGWEAALGVWIFPALISIGLWIYFVKYRTSADDVQMYYGRADDLNMWQSPLAWQVAIFFGLQAFSYNALMTWLPEILIEYGTSSNSAGWMLSFNQLIGLPASLLIPIIAGKFRSQRSIIMMLCFLSLSGDDGNKCRLTRYCLWWIIPIIVNIFRFTGKKCTRSSETFRYGTSSWLFTRSNWANLIRILARFNREVERIHLHFNWYNNIHCINRFRCWARPSCFEVII